MSTKLTPQQLAVVENCGGDLLVSAAADSGKTKVLVEKLMREICVNKRNIIDFIIISYTQKAASELRMKIRPEIAARLAENPGDKQRKAKELRQLCMDDLIEEAYSKGSFLELVLHRGD